MSLTARVLSAAWALFVLATAAPSSACGNSVQEERATRAYVARREVLNEDELIGRLLRAEQALRSQSFANAASELDIVGERRLLAGARTLSRYARVSALVTVRSAGAWPQAVARLANTTARRTRALEGAIQKLRLRALEAPADPIRLSDLGEALATLPKHHKEARRVLEALAADDLVTSAHAYAALAKVRRAASDEKGALAAFGACRKLDEKGVACRSHGEPGA